MAVSLSPLPGAAIHAAGNGMTTTGNRTARPV